MTSNLEDLKAQLYQAFDKSVLKAQYPTYMEDSPKVSQAAAASLTAAAELARSIVEVERELTNRSEKKDGMKMPGK